MNKEACPTAMTEQYTVARNRCNCHPETCSCNPWVVLNPEGMVVMPPSYSKEWAERVKDAFNSQLRAVQTACGSAPDTGRGYDAEPIDKMVRQLDVAMNGDGAAKLSDLKQPNKPKFKMSVEDMLSFNDDCEMAARHCPQWRGQAVDDRDICLGKIAPKQLVKYWRQCDTLWQSGYHRVLSVDAVEVFAEYKAYKKKLAAWKLERLSKKG